MSLKFPLLVCAIFAAIASLTPRVRAEAPRPPVGAEKPIHEFTRIQVQNFQDEPLGRIKDLAIDLVNGRIVQVLVVSDSTLNVDRKVVAVPPGAFLPDLLNRVYRLNVSTEVFKSAPAVDLSQWADAGRSESVAASYHLFGQEPYFLEVGATPSATDERPKVSLGYVERSSKIIDLSVGNLQHEKLGKVWSMTLDIPRGRIVTVIVLAPGNFQTKSVIPATALNFNDARNGLLLDDTKIEFAEEPRYVFTEAAFGNDSYSEEESYKGPRTHVALVQGNSYRDIDRTILINRGIRAAKISARNVEVGTNDGRVTLRGWVTTEQDKNHIEAIAISASRLELVDNQITVGRPASGK